MCQGGSHFLICARSKIKVQTLRRLKEAAGAPCRCSKKAINASLSSGWKCAKSARRVQRPGFRPVQLRLWTSLLDPETAPALELVQLYAQRWEHELYYRELKRAIAQTDVLQSHTLKPAPRKSPPSSRQRPVGHSTSRRGEGQTPVLRVSFIKTLELMRPLWLTLALGGDLLTPRQKQQLTERFLQRASRYLTPRKRPRSCP